MKQQREDKESLDMEEEIKSILKMTEVSKKKKKIISSFS